MDARGAYLDRIFSEDDIPSQDDIRAAAQEELNHLKQRAVMPWIGMLENWQHALSKRLGRSAEDIFEGNLLATDFSNDSVHVQFEDGTDLTFRRAFYVGETPADGAIHRVAVFTDITSSGLAPVIEFRQVQCLAVDINSLTKIWPGIQWHQ